MAYETILVDEKGPVGLITLNRPEALNALCEELFIELKDALVAFENNDAIGSIVITGSARAFAAGADIKEMQSKTFHDVYNNNFMETADYLIQVRKPVIAAVAGFALGGGCELAMMCDFILAADTAKFGQPEIKLGTIPGIGGSQRLTAAIGKAKAMEMCLTGRMMDAEEAERAGLVSRIIPADELLDDALKTATTIAEMGRPSVMMTKEAVNAFFELPLKEGLRFERRLFHATFGTEDQKEGMEAFIEKRSPHFRNR